MRRLHFLLAGALVLLTLVVYAPVRHHQFVSLDDSIYVTDNGHVKAGLTAESVGWAFTSSHANFWHPLTWLSLMLDVHLFGVSPGALHVTAALLHLLATLLLFLVLARMTAAPGRSALVAALFAVHPLHVESVAWISERKDVLSAVFWMLTLVAYLAYVRRPRWTRYLMVIVTFAVGLMAKPMLVTLPVVLLLLDVWPLRRWEGDLSAIARSAKAEKLPLFALALAASIVAFLTQHGGGAVADTTSFPFTGRLANALVSLISYIIKTAWPVHLVPFYPYPQSIAVLPAVAALLALVTISIIVFRLRRTRPYLAVGWFWYVITLLPVAGLVQVGSHSMADRYTYIPLVGVFIIVAWGVPDLVGARRGRIALPVVACAAIVAATVTAREQVFTWRNSVTLWQHAVDVMPDNYYAHNAVGLELKKQRRTGEAMAQFIEAARLAPGFPNAQENIGTLLAAEGRTADAVEHYAAALRVAPGRTQTHLLIGDALLKAGRLDEAFAHDQEAVLLSNSAEARVALGNVLLAMGRVEEAVAHYQEALRADPASADAHYNLANATLRIGRLEEAVVEYQQALRLQPGLVEARNNLGAALERLGRPADAIAQYEESLRLDPQSANARCNLGTVLLAMGRAADAAAQYREALIVEPENAQAHTNLGSALQEMGRIEEAIAEHAEAIRVSPGFADAHFNLANALVAAGRLDDAAAQYRETLRLEGDSADVRQLLAGVEQRLKRK